MEIRIDNLENIREAAKSFINEIGDRKVFAFYGKMGAGKTTFIKAICEELGVELEEVYDMGYEDYFYSGALCFIEWPELIEEVLPEDAVKVTITEQADGTRTINF